MGRGNILKMKNLFKGKSLSILVILLTIILGGVAIFTAIKLYQQRQQTLNRPKAAGCVQPTTNLSVSNVTTTSATLNWVSGSDAKYEFLIVGTSTSPINDCNTAAGRENSPTCIAIYDDATATHILPSQTSLTLNNLKPGTRYSWKMWSWKYSGCDSGTAVQSFITPLTPGGGSVTTAGCNLSFTRSTSTAPACIAVKAYNSSWTFLSDSDLSAITSGTTVNFCVSGSATSGTFDKAQFKINSTLEPETTTTRPGSNDFCQSYQIQSNSPVSVQAKIHHVTEGWLGENI